MTTSKFQFKGFLPVDADKDEALEIEVEVEVEVGAGLLEAEAATRLAGAALTVPVVDVVVRTGSVDLDKKLAIENQLLSLENEPEAELVVCCGLWLVVV